MTRFEFTKTQKRDMLKRSGGICEAGKEGTETFYGMKKGETCAAHAKEFDHVIADGLKREKPRSIDEGLHVCLMHHKNKTHGNDRPKIEKAKREFFVGNLYINRKCTGAMVGAHPFGGFNMSGTDSKAGGPDYLLQFLQAKSIGEKIL